MDRSRKGRGAVSNATSRFDEHQRESFDDGWRDYWEGEEDPALRTTVLDDHSRTIITYNESPDVGFDRSINPYRGCEHGCIYCYARPTHAYLGLSAGIDFETKIFAKRNARELLTTELSKPRYQPAPLALGGNTDPYQPVERRLGITRGVLEVLDAFRHPVTVVTKSALIERDIDILARMARSGLVSVAVSVTSLDNELSRRLEPRAAAPQRRLTAIRRLTEAGIPVGVLVAPVIPVLTDCELEAILAAAREAGAIAAGYVLLRLPHEVKDLFDEWLAEHYPLKARHVASVIAAMRGGKAYDAQFGTRMRGSGEYAQLLAQRFGVATRRHGYSDWPELNCGHFATEVRSGQYSLF